MDPVIVSLAAPLRGWVGPLDEVDDPVFAGRMLGDGVAIDPTGSVLCAPCDGQVLSLHAAGHAVTLRAECGAEILLHVGLETVALAGDGFRGLVEDGAMVKAGDPLIEFDLDLLASRARNLVTPIVITNGDDFEIVRREQGRRTEVGDPLMEVRALRPASAVPHAPAAADGATASRQAVIPLTHGLHARPSALLAAEAKRHAAEITVAGSGKSANAKSPVAVMALGLAHLERVNLSATGPGAEEAVAALARLIEHGMPPEPPAAASQVLVPPQPTEVPSPGVLQGVAAAPGLAIGSAVRLIAPEIAVEEHSRGAPIEVAALREALEAVRDSLSLQAQIGPREQGEILRAHLAFLDDDELNAAARATIASGASAGVAWRKAVRAQADVLRQVRDPLIAQRAADLLDLERQVLIALSGEPEPALVLPTHAIVVADDLGPAQLMALPPTLSGVCTALGGPTSHVAILATALNIPAVVALGPCLAEVASGATLIVDGRTGRLRVGPDAAEIEAAQTELAAIHNRRREARVLASEPCRMADGTRIEVLANVGALADAEAARANGAEGCGLLRTEFLFLGRDSAPDEDEQARSYQAIADALDGAPVVIRTLDIGGDKPAPFLALPAEENPALGLRGVRVSLWRPELLRTQLRAILRVRPHGQCRILIPMVASVDELLDVRAQVDAVRAETEDQEPVQVGVMIETPAAAVTADLIAAHADFLSIGTNDLTQYALAMDRGNPALAGGIDALHPAVLRLIEATCAGARRHDRPVAVCGGLAADVAATAVLIGLGVTELSAPPAVIPEIKAAVRVLSMGPCQALARRALACSNPAEVRALVASSADAGARA